MLWFFVLMALGLLIAIILGWFGEKIPMTIQYIVLMGIIIVSLGWMFCVATHIITF